MEKLKCQSWKINLTHNVSGIVLEVAYSFESQSTVKKKNQVITLAAETASMASKRKKNGLQGLT